MNTVAPVAIRLSTTRLRKYTSASVRCANRPPAASTNRRSTSGRPVHTRDTVASAPKWRRYSENDVSRISPTLSGRSMGGGMAEKILQSQHARARPPDDASRLSPAPRDRDPRARGARPRARRHRKPRAGRGAGHDDPDRIGPGPDAGAHDPGGLRHHLRPRRVRRARARRLRGVEWLLHPVRGAAARADAG